MILTILAYIGLVLLGFAILLLLLVLFFETLPLIDWEQVAFWIIGFLVTAFMTWSVYYVFFRK